MNPTNCPGCAAPLDPLAAKCTYCGVVTPRGRADAERADWEIKQRQAGQAAYASIAFAHTAQNVAKNANIALVLTIVSFVTCCSPVGWIGLFFAYSSLSNAKKNGIPAPVTAKVAAALGVLGTLVMVGVFVASHFDQQDKEKRIAAIEAKIEKARHADAIDAKTACSIAEAYFLRSGKMYVSSEIACTGKLVVTGNTARLDGVAIVKQKKKQEPTYRICFAKSARWYLAHAGESQEKCLDEAPEAANETAEQVVRDDYPRLLKSGEAPAADKKLAAIRAVTAAAGAAEKKCTDATIAAALTAKGAKTPFATRTIDGALLDGSDVSAFDFETDPDILRFVRTAKDPGAARADDAHAVLDAPIVVVYRHKTRSTASIVDKGTRATTWGYGPPTFDGTMYVVDVAKAEVLCQGPLAVTSPAKPTFSISRGMRRDEVEDEARYDFRDRFLDESAARLAAMSASKLTPARR